ncbi:sulfatase [Chloroflexota bacterium]
MNVLLLTIDCLRHDKVGYVAGRTDLTPNIDRFGQEATVFTQAIAQSYTTYTSFPSIFTSTYPNLQQGSWPKKPVLSGQPTLAALLGEQGFATGGFHSNPWLSTHFGYGQEYDLYEDNLLPSAIPSSSKGTLRLSRVLHAVYPYRPAGKVTAQALSWIRQQRDPFFAWIHYMDAHGPYLSSRQLPMWLGHVLGWSLYRKAQNRPEAITPSERQVLLNRYEGGVRFVDRVLGTLWRELESSGQLGDTLVIITADHGEAFGEHGHFTHGHVHLFDEVLRVPLVVRWPGQETVPQVSGQTELTTIVPTVLDALGLQIPDHVVGRSAVPWLLGEVSSEETISTEAISSGRITEQYASVSVRTGEWKYIIRRSMTRQSREVELYHLASDPDEQVECSQRYPEVSAQMNQRAEAHVHRVLEGTTPAAEEGEELPEEVVARLRALGYMD